MALIGNMIAISSGPSVINYDMFVAVFCMLSLFYLGLVSFKESFAIHAAFPLTLDILCTLFTLIAGIATPAYLHVRSCSNQVSISNHNTARLRYIVLTVPTGLSRQQHRHPRLWRSLP